MRITTSDLRNVLRVTAPAISARPQHPTLAAVTITSNGEGATFAATDFETWISTSVPSIDGRGDDFVALVSHRALSTIAKVVSGRDVALAVDGSRLTIKSGSASWTIPLMPAEDAPKHPQMPTEFGRIDAMQLRQVVGMTADGASRDATTMQVMCGVQVVTSGETLRLATTDRYQIRLAESTHHRSVDVDVAVNVDARTLHRVVESLSGEIALHASTDSGMFGISNEATSVIIRTIEGDMPAVARLTEGFLSQAKAVTRVEGAVLTDAIKASAPMVDGKGGVLLTVTAESMSVESSGENGGAEIPVEHVSHEGDGLSVMVNPAFLLGALGALTGGEVAIRWGGPTKALVMTADSLPGASVVVMVIRDERARWLSGAAAMAS